MTAYFEHDLFVYCSDSTLITKLQKLIFRIDESEELMFSMNQLLPLPTGFSGYQDYKIYGRHWRKLLWGVDHDGQELRQNISENKVDVHFKTPWEPANKWFETFCRMAELVYKDFKVFPEPELVVLYACGIDGTMELYYSHWEPGKDIVIQNEFPEKSRKKLSNLFGDHPVECYGGLWW